MKQHIFHVMPLAVAAVFGFSSVNLHAEGVAPVQTATQKAVIRYKLDTCLVSADKLGDMGKPVVFVYQNHEIKLCCKDCRKSFDKEPEKYLKQLEGK